ncbi:hypothetical protein GCM10020360_11530 [Nonlabens tegetincola]
MSGGLSNSQTTTSAFQPALSILPTNQHLLPIARLARAFPDKIALITDDAALSYSELNRRAAALAASLSARGVAPGDRVSLLSQNRWEWIVSYHAALRLGAVVNPLNAMLTADEFEYVSADAGSNVLIASTEHLATVAASLPRLDSLRLVVVFEATAGASTSGAARSDAASGTIEHVPFSELLRPAQPEFSPVAAAPDELACIAYTSGTTGRPKGAMQTQRSLLLNCAYTATMHGRSAADTVVTALPATHVYGNMAIHSVLLVGGTVVLMSRFDAGRALALIDQHRATLIDGVPAMYAMMLADPGLETADLSTLTRSIVGGQVIAPSVVERREARTGAPLIELWGMTELSGLGTTHAQHAPNVHGSIGVALPGVEARVADVADPRRTCAVDEPGELVIRGPIVMQGYHNNPVATAKAIDDEGWLHTGDVVTRPAPTKKAFSLTRASASRRTRFPAARSTS